MDSMQIKFSVNRRIFNPRMEQIFVATESSGIFYDSNQKTLYVNVIQSHPPFIESNLQMNLLKIYLSES